MTHYPVSAYHGSVAYAAYADCVLDYRRTDAKDKTDPCRVLEVGKPARWGGDRPRPGQQWHMCIDDTVTYSLVATDAPKREGAKLKPSKVQGLAERVAAFVKTHPKTTKAATARHFEIAKGGSASYRVLSEAYDATCTESHADAKDRVQGFREPF